MCAGGARHDSPALENGLRHTAEPWRFMLRQGAPRPYSAKIERSGCHSAGRPRDTGPYRALPLFKPPKAWPRGIWCACPRETDRPYNFAQPHFADARHPPQPHEFPLRSRAAPRKSTSSPRCMRDELPGMLVAWRATPHISPHSRQAVQAARRSGHRAGSQPDRAEPDAARPTARAASRSTSAPQFQPQFPRPRRRSSLPRHRGACRATTSKRTSAADARPRCARRSTRNRRRTPSSNRSASRCKSSPTTPTSCSTCITTYDAGAASVHQPGDLWPEVEPLARYLDAKASLLALNSVGNPFDEIHSFCWSDMHGRFGERHPIPNGSISVTIELRWPARGVVRVRGGRCSGHHQLSDHARRHDRRHRAPAPAALTLRRLRAEPIVAPDQRRAGVPLRSRRGSTWAVKSRTSSIR